MSHEHSPIIDQLGGHEALAAKLAAFADGAPNVEAIRKWRINGVPWQWRNSVVDLLREKRITVPAGFEPPRARRNGKQKAA